MALENMVELMKLAQKQNYALSAFEFWSLDSAQAVVWAAESLNLPVILQAGPFECQYAGVEELAWIAKMVAKRAKVPVALHLDHGDTFDLAQAAVNAGFTSVMIDASHLDFAANSALTKRVSDMAHARGVSVEGELGRIPGTEGNQAADEAEAFQTSPTEALTYRNETGIDCLAVAIGSAHGFYRFTPRLNISRLNEIMATVGIPLVLHGGSGIPEDQIAESILHGISKINICTEFVAAFGRAYTATQAAEGFRYSVPSLFAPSRQAGMELARRKIAEFAQNRVI